MTNDLLATPPLGTRQRLEHIDAMRVPFRGLPRITSSLSTTTVSPTLSLLGHGRARPSVPNRFSGSPHLTSLLTRSWGNGSILVMFVHLS